MLISTEVNADRVSAIDELLKLEDFSKLIYLEPPKTFRKGTMVYLPDEYSDQIYFLESGAVKLGAYSEDGKEIIKSVILDNGIFGEMGLIGGVKRDEFAQVMEEANVRTISVNQMKELMQTNIEISLKITQYLGMKLMKTQKRLESLMLKSTNDRVIEFLVGQAHDRGRRVGYEILIMNIFTHQEIAQYTGTSRQSVTTILNDLRGKNLIYFDRKRLLIRDLDKLKSLLE